MAGAQDFVFNRAPTVADFPQFNGNWISNLPNDLWAGQQYKYNRDLQTMFQGPQGQQMLQQSGIPTNSLLGGIIQRGGAQYALPAAGAILNSQLYDQTVNGGGNYPAAPTGGSDPRGVVPWIVSEAKRLGIDPGTAVKVATSEGLADYKGDNGTSWGAFQLHTGGGLGDEFKAETGLDPRDPKNEKQMITWTLENLRRTGWEPYHGARKVGVGPRQGIGALPQEAQAGVAQPGTGAPAPVEQPKGATGNAPFMAQSSQNGTSPASIGGAVQVASTDTAVGANQEGSPNSTAERASVSGGGTDTSSPPPPSSNSPNNRAIAQGPSPTTGQEGEVPPGYTREAVANRRAAAAAVRNRAGYVGQRFGKEAQAAEEAKAADQEKQADTIEKFLNEREQQKFGVGIKQREEMDKFAAARSDAMTKGVNATARDYETELEPYLKVARSLVDQPGMYSGFAGNRSLDFNKVKAAFGDQQAAMLQEAFKKVRGQVVLNTINNQRTQMLEAGSNSSRIFSRTAATIEEAVPGLETSPAGIRALIEIQSRMGEQAKKIRDMASAYKLEKVRSGQPPLLDDGFDERVTRELKEHPAFNEYDLAHPQTLGAPTAPAGLRTKEEYSNWGQGLGLKPGDPFRTPGGKVVPLP